MSDQEIDHLARLYVHLTASEFEGYMEGTLGAGQLARVEKHVMMCALCSEEMQTFGETFELWSNSPSATGFRELLNQTVELPSVSEPLPFITRASPNSSPWGARLSASWASLSKESSRRQFLATAAFSVGTAAAATTLPAPFIARSTRDAGQALIERVRPAFTRIEVLNNLLRPTGKLIGVPGGSLVNPSPEDLRKVEVWKQIGFPHDRAALDLYAIFIPEVELCDTEKLINLPEEASIVTTGSPAQNKISQSYLPYRNEADNGKTISRMFSAESIPYHYEFLVEQRLRRVPHEAGRIALAPHKGLSANGKTHLADTSDNGSMLRHDFLLISRLPRGIGGTADIIAIGGGFGPGTEAVQLLFDRREFPDSEVRELEKAIGDAQYFQVAFVCDLDDYGNAHNLRIWDQCPPVRIRPEALRPAPSVIEGGQGTSLLPMWEPKSPKLD